MEIEEKKSLPKKYEVTLTVHVDEEAYFLEVGDTNNLKAISEEIYDALYDLEGIKIKEIDITRRLG